ncbi:MAG: ABC transporter ATP-binding protein [Pseudomonadales bacterium]|jgi:lipoprotein-releasing system ATP-binding protein|nr:ABC transporter ATP-binding protein [Pseudomonadales bacterium]MDP6472902.1 ABC transporter ATP-binding protein [Pseudomonadales bacterium]MDP6826341.1 ABC transporter ATP-binding protein [Pseudomonadales bacterium]MDP6973272.1 ABC transporter ATP-binding protein [Pseudomonadales bacterium]|tara:strand:- start:375 stop:1046 length:672 start_codon:yes stop_codon:yes gene_type:complete
MSEVLSATELSRGFVQGSTRIEVLRGVSCAIDRGERVAIVGRSGSGKSTLLHLLAGLDDPDEGFVHVCGENLTNAGIECRAAIRNRHMGFVYQLHHLLPEFSAAENVSIPLRLRGETRKGALQRASHLLHAVGLEQRMTHRPSALSGGERQRVAVARALAGSPDIVLADEPTGNLDRQNAQQVFELMCHLSETEEVALVVVTHDEDIARSMHRVLRLSDGKLT